MILLLCGCKDKSLTCNINIENKELNYELTGKYKIYYKKSFVTKIEEKEKYQSNDKDVIRYLNESKDIEYDNLNNRYGGYEYNITKEKNDLNIYISIDISKVDIEKMVKDEYLSNYYINKNKLTLGGMRLFYESKGAICES